MARHLYVVRHLVTRAVAAAEGDQARLELLRELEDLKSFAAAAQAEVAVAFDRGVQARRDAAGVSRRLRDRGIAAEIAVARRESPHRGVRLLGLARALVEDLPHTHGALRAGVLSEFRAMLVARETDCLSRDDRVAVDRLLCGDPARIDGWGTGRLTAEARALAYRLDPDAALARAARARSDRHVGLRPAPDTMTWLSAALPVEYGVAVQATLGRLADSAVATGDGRSRGQLMADALVQRVTGLDLGVPAGVVDPTRWLLETQQQAGDRPTRAVVPVGVDLVISDETLLGGGAESAWLTGYGPIPAPLARDLVGRAQGEAMASLRRLYARPDDGALVALESRARNFPAGLTHLVLARDRTCRTPWCGAPVRHVDHVTDWVAGGATAADNAQGLCQQCNHAKQAPGWVSDAHGPPGRAHRVILRTPGGLQATSRAPDPPRPWRHWPKTVVVEIYRAVPRDFFGLGA